MSLDAAGFSALDRLIHEPARLGIVSVLAPRQQASFSELKEALDLTDGNLSVHLRALEEGGYIDIEKSFVGKRPRTVVRLTRAGREALTRHLDALEAILRAARRRRS